MNQYAVIGPTAEQYHEVLKEHGIHPQRAIAELRQIEGDVQPMSFIEMQQFYRQNQLWRSSGCVYAYFILENGKPQCEVYPDASWLTIMESPKMHKTVVGEIDQEFQRLMATPVEQEDGTFVGDNYAQIPVMWRGLEYRAIAQVLTPRELGPGMSADTVIFRPLYLHIDPFLLTRLTPPKGFDKSDKAMEPPEPKGPPGMILPDNVIKLN